jgi:SOS-response transcriptional repressor LexA
LQKSYYAIIPANVRYDKDLPANAKLLYGEITALCNEKGYCWAGNSYFSELYKVTNRTISGWINALEQKGYIDRTIVRNKETQQVEKRIISISESKPVENNFLPYGKNLHEGIEENFRKNITVINTTNNNTYSNEFEQFWNEYPRKVDKKKAHTSFKKCIKKHPIDSIVNGTKKYARQVQNTEKKFIKHPATFLNNESFLYGIEEDREQTPLREIRQFEEGDMLF